MRPAGLFINILFPALLSVAASCSPDTAPSEISSPGLPDGFLGPVDSRPGVTIQEMPPFLRDALMDVGYDGTYPIDYSIQPDGYLVLTPEYGPDRRQVDKLVRWEPETDEEYRRVLGILERLTVPLDSADAVE